MFVNLLLPRVVQDDQCILILFSIQSACII